MFYFNPAEDRLSHTLDAFLRGHAEVSDVVEAIRDLSDTQVLETTGGGKTRFYYMLECFSLAQKFDADTNLILEAMLKRAFKVYFQPGMDHLNGVRFMLYRKDNFDFNAMRFLQHLKLEHSEYVEAVFKSFPSIFMVWPEQLSKPYGVQDMYKIKSMLDTDDTYLHELFDTRNPALVAYYLNLLYIMLHRGMLKPTQLHRLFAVENEFGFKLLENLCRNTQDPKIFDMAHNFLMLSMNNGWLRQDEYINLMFEYGRGSKALLHRMALQPCPEENETYLISMILYIHQLAAMRKQGHISSGACVDLLTEMNDRGVPAVHQLINAVNPRVAFLFLDLIIRNKLDLSDEERLHLLTVKNEKHTRRSGTFVKSKEARRENIKPYYREVNAALSDLRIELQDKIQIADSRLHIDTSMPVTSERSFFKPVEGHSIEAHGISPTGVARDLTPQKLSNAEDEKELKRLLGEELYDECFKL